MAHNEAKSQLRLTVSAVIARLRIPARLLTELNPASWLEIEPDDAISPILTFEVQGHTIARGYVKERDGMLLATIFWTGCEPSERRPDQWALRREPVAGDANDGRSGDKRAE